MYAEQGTAEPVFYGPQRAGGPALQKLLPGYRFIIVAWDMRATSSRPVSLAARLYNVLALDPQGHTDVLWGYGNYEEFGTLLSRARVRIRSSDDADLVWHVFNEALAKSWDKTNERTNEYQAPGTWRLGVSTHDGIRYYYEVQLDASQTVKSTRLSSVRLSADAP